MYKVTVSSKLANGFGMVMTLATPYTYMEDALNKAHEIVENMRENGRSCVHALITESATTVMVIE